MLEEAPGRICGSVEDPSWSRLFLKDYIPWKEPTLEQGRNVRSPVTEEERAGEAMFTELFTVLPILFSDYFLFLLILI